MTASRTPSEPHGFTSPIIDYEPAPAPLHTAACPPPTPSALHRRHPRGLRSVTGMHVVREPQPPREAVVFGEGALRRLLEVIDRRRPVAQLRPLLAPALIDVVIALARDPHPAAATLQRVRIRMVEAADGETSAAELFATYTRGQRVHAIAARIDMTDHRWRITALQVG